MIMTKIGGEWKKRTEPNNKHRMYKIAIKILHHDLNCLNLRSIFHGKEQRQRSVLCVNDGFYRDTFFPVEHKQATASMY